MKNSKKHRVVSKTRKAKTARSTVRPAVIKARVEGLRLFKVAGRPSKADVIKVYGPKRPWMTWARRAAAGVPAAKFQAALKEAIGTLSRGGSPHRP
jgi:hypothetical protein